MLIHRGKRMDRTVLEHSRPTLEEGEHDGGRWRSFLHVYPEPGLRCELCVLQTICLLGHVCTSGRFWKVLDGSMWMGRSGAQGTALTGPGSAVQTPGRPFSFACWAESDRAESRACVQVLTLRKRCRHNKTV